MLPSYNVPHDYQSGSMELARAYALIGQTKQAQQIINALWQKSMEYMRFYNALDSDHFASCQQDCLLHLYILNQVMNLEQAVDTRKGKAMEKELQAIAKQYESKGGNYGN